VTFGLQVDAHGIEAIQQELLRLERRGHSLATAHQKIGGALESRIQQRFDSKSDPLGHPWAAHSAATIEAYRKRDTNKRGKHSARGSLLERTRRMRLSLGFASDLFGVTVGFGVPYAAFFEFSTKHMVRRGLLMADPVAGTLAPADVNVILNTLHKHFAT
jgi:phage gpG-like protein